MTSQRPVRTPVRNRLARPLPDEWRRELEHRGVPKRKYTAVCRVTLADGSTRETVVIEEGWIIATDPDVLADVFEQRIDFSPADIRAMDVVTVV